MMQQRHDEQLPLQSQQQSQQQQQTTVTVTAAASSSSSSYVKKRHLHRRPLFQFQVTKLRSWRTGYTRLLVLYEKEFVTLDPAGSTAEAAIIVSGGGGGGSGGDYAPQPTQTNAWPYASLLDWLALPDEPNSILLQVGPKHDKLKFQCHNVHRSIVLTALLQCQDRAVAAAAATTTTTTPNRVVTTTTTPTMKTFPHVERWTRHGTKQSVVLVVKPYGIQEVHVTTRAVLQTYLFKDIRAVSLANNNNNSTSTLDPHNGIASAAAACSLYLHFRQARKIRLYEVHSTSTRSTSTTGVLGNRPASYNINTSSNSNNNNNNSSTSLGGQGRTELIAAMQEQYERLGLPLQMEVSMSMSDWLMQRQQGLSSATFASTATLSSSSLLLLLGPMATSWPVSKSTRRHDVRMVGNKSNVNMIHNINNDSSSSNGSWMGGVVRRTLCITAKAWLVECDNNSNNTNHMISMRPLYDLWALIRHEGSRADQVTLIYTDGSQRCYTCTSGALHAAGGGGGAGGGSGGGSARDALVVSILDAAATMANNTTVHLLSDCHLYHPDEQDEQQQQGLQLSFYSTFGGTVHCSESLSWTREVLYRIQHGIPAAVSSSSFASSSSGSKAAAVTGAAAAALFQPVSIPIYCLRRIHALSTRAYAYVSGDFNLHPPSSQQQQQQQQQQSSLSSLRQTIMSTQELLIQVKGTVEACREFNANVLPTGEGLSTTAASSSSNSYKPDKVISGTIGALWGLVAKLLLGHHHQQQHHQQQQQVSMPPQNQLQQQQQDESSLVASTNRNMRDLQMAEQAAATILQSLFRLSKTPTGYHASVELTTFQECISALCSIQDTFCKFWAFSVLKVRRRFMIFGHGRWCCILNGAIF
jgi:DNAJ protein RME-8 N-terminal